jgi:UPF0755 protein
MTQIPREMTAQFGPVSPALSFSQQLAYSVRLYLNQPDLLNPVNAGGAPEQFDVGIGESVTSVSARLEQAGLIPDAELFRDYLVYAGYDTSLQAGTYQLSPAMSALQIARALQDSTPTEVKFVILPGWRAEEIAAALPTSGLSISQEEFLQLVRNPPADLKPAGAPDVAVLEGFLMPGEYQVKRDVSAHDLAAMFIDRFTQSISPDLLTAYSNRGLSLDQAVTLASMVQREAMVQDEQPVIASVFYNRLGQGMKLDSDPTVQYALGFDESNNTWWKNPLSQENLQIDSRYNTYIYPGLPPSAICNPGIEALQAVANPTETGYFYFRAKCDGSGRHVFSATYEEHLENACP